MNDLHATAHSAEKSLEACLEGEMIPAANRPVAAALIEIVRCISLGQGEAIVGEKVWKLIETLSLPDASGEVIKASVSFDAIKNELSRRSKQRKEITGIQESLENERDHKRTQLRVAEEMLANSITEGAAGENYTQVAADLKASLGHLDKKIEMVIGIVSGNDRDVSAIRKYDTAMRDVREGLPAGLIGGSLDLTL